MSEKNRDKKFTWALLISIVALLLCLLVLALWVFEVMPHSVIAPDSFIGACVSLLAVVVTLAVGSQIVNVMEVKSAQRKYEEELKTALEKIQQQQAQIEANRHANTHLHNCAFAVVMELNKDYAKACYYYLSAVYEGLQTKNAEGNIDFVFFHWRKCLDDSKVVEFVVPSALKDELKTIDALFAQLPNARLIMDKYRPLRDEYFKKIGIKSDNK